MQAGLVLTPGALVILVTAPRVEAVAAHSGRPPRRSRIRRGGLCPLGDDQGGSFGIAAVTTLLARRSQFHETVLVSHVRPFDSRTLETLRSLRHARGALPPSLRPAAMFSFIQPQVSFLSFLDGFRLLALFSLCIVPLTLLVLRAVSTRAPSPAH